MTSPELVVAIDTREQKPYRFPRSEVMTLATGDYSVVGLEDRIAIERKTKEDAYSSLGQGRARFERELQRLSRFDYAAIVIETSLPEFLQAPAFSRMNPRSRGTGSTAKTWRARRTASNATFPLPAPASITVLPSRSTSSLTAPKSQSWTGRAS